MFVTIEVNGKKLRAEKGETILSALNCNGLDIPTLCRMAGLTPTGACRMCVVEVEGLDKLVTSCSYPVAEWMKIRTHSPRVLSARRTIVELLLASHPKDCLACDSNLKCELQQLACELNITEKQVSEKPRSGRKGDLSSPAITREPDKCIICGRCVRVCDEQVGVGTFDFLSKGSATHIGVAMDRDLNLSSCIFCGLCVRACPTGALHEKGSITQVQDHLFNDDADSSVLYSPLVSIGIAEELGVKFTPEFERNLNSALKNMGFSRVYSTGSGTDIMLTELAGEIVDRKSGDTREPLYSSHCPAWVKYAEQALPGMVKDITTLKTAQGITGLIARQIAGSSGDKEAGLSYRVSVSPCLASKFDAERDIPKDNSLPDISSVLTVRELLRLLKIYGIDLSNSGSRFADEPMSLRSSVADMTEMSGGLTEAVARIIKYNSGSEAIPVSVIRKFRSGGTFRELAFAAGDKSYNFAVVDGLKSLENLFESIRKGNRYDFVEVTACRGGCVESGGMRSMARIDYARERQRLILKSDDQSPMEVPSRNPEVSKLYSLLHDNLKLDGKELLRREYKQRNVLL